MELFDYNSLTPLKTIKLPITNDGKVRPLGRFVFANAKGFRLYVVVEADRPSSLLYNFGVFTMELTRK